MDNVESRHLVRRTSASHLFKLLPSYHDRHQRSSIDWNLSWSPPTTYENQHNIPYAVRWMDQTENKYNAVCWQPRTDFTPQKSKPIILGHKWDGILVFDIVNGLVEN
jgi:hypothetical protein